MYPYYESDWSILPPENNRRFSPGISITTIKQAINETIESGILRKQTPIRLRDLIRQIRSARTAAEERAVVNTECAYIRSTFREDDPLWKCRNMAKLLYIHMLGYPAHFGQLECLKLAAGSKYSDKRIGYLGAMLLLDERQDVHLLITNSLKNDLKSPVQFIVGLALCTLGAIASPNMSKDLAIDIERLMLSTNVYLRKKAILCAFKLIRKVPDLIELFIPPTIPLLNNKNHSILIGAVTLITEMCEQNIGCLIYYKSIIQNLVKILKTITSTSYNIDFSINGVGDPFLTIKILRLLSILGRNDPQHAEIMNDVLAQVATNTDSSKNVGNAVLYETVLTIMNIKSEGALRVLAVNILGRFLLNIDKNIRFVSLRTLIRTVQSDNTAMQRHRNTILECLKEQDNSIQKCAMELAFSLINGQNVQTIVKELIEYLKQTDPEMKATCSSGIVMAAEHYAPSVDWHLDTLLKVLLIAGNNIRDDVMGSMIQLIANSLPTEQQKICRKLLETILSHTYFEDKQPLLQVAVWAIGEFGDCTIYNPEELIEFYRQILFSTLLSTTSKQYILVSLAKVSVKAEHCKTNIQEILDFFSCHLNVDLQQRAVEFNQLLNKYDHLRPSLLERMPVLKIQRISDDENHSYESESESEASLEIVRNPQEKNSSLLDLLGSGLENLVMEPKPMHQIQYVQSQNDFMDLLGLEIPSSPQPVQSINEFNSAMISALERDELDVKLICNRENEGTAMITVMAKNKSLNIFDKFIVQAAIPKSYMLNMLPPSSTVILPGETMTQNLKIMKLQNTAAFRMKIRVSYDVDNYSALEQADLNCFPNDLFD